MEETTKKEKKRKARTAVGIIFLIIFAVITVFSFLFHDEWFSHDGWFMTHNTGSSLFNVVLRFVPRIVNSIQVLFVALFALYLICFIVSKIFRGTPRRITIGKLVNSIVKVVIWVAAIISVLAIWGIDLKTLLAGAGVLALIIGLGMQSLIADVVAGVFIVCDGTLQVGDIVTIDGWRGTVQEIGIRNTKLINYSGDIRIANNSTIQTFINQSRENSYPTVEISITYEEDISRVEKLFEEHREELKARLPRVIDGPDYKGVSNLGESSVDLLFGATCKEDDFFQVQRDMRGVLRMFFMEQGIDIPFPQLDVHFDKEVKAPTKKSTSTTKKTDSTDKKEKTSASNTKEKTTTRKKS